MLLSSKAGNAPKLAQFVCGVFNRVRSNSTVLAFFVLARGFALIVMGVAQTPSSSKVSAALVLCFSRCSSFQGFVRRRAALVLSASRASFVLFRPLQAWLARYPVRALSVLAFRCCKSGFCPIRFAGFPHLLSAVTGAALAVSCVCDGFRLWSKSVRAKVRPLAASPQQQANKALHPTAYSLRSFLAPASSGG